MLTRSDDENNDHHKQALDIARARARLGLPLRDRDVVALHCALSTGDLRRQIADAARAELHRQDRHAKVQPQAPRRDRRPGRQAPRATPRVTSSSSTSTTSAEPPGEPPAPATPGTTLAAIGARAVLEAVNGQWGWARRNLEALCAKKVAS